MDRAARTSPARQASPASDEYWIERKRADPAFAAATDAQVFAAAKAAKKAYFARLALSSAKARACKAGAA